MLDRKARHFHAGKLRKRVGGVEYVEVAESNGKVFVGRNGLLITPMRPDPYPGTLMYTGYYEVNLNQRPVAVHRLVAEMFIGDIGPRMEVDHLDAVPGNNAVENLRIVTSKENSRNPLTYSKFFTTHDESLKKAREAHRKPVIGVMLGAPKILGPFKSCRDAARAAGISWKNLSNSLRGKSKTAGGYVWMSASAWLKYREAYHV